jgi:Txe/YoeB family toxin of toxin-antitoxin system
MWDVRFSKNAEKDKRLLKQAGLEEKAKRLLDILRVDPFQNPPSYEKLVGDLKGFYSRRINLQNRLVYKVDLEKKTVEVRLFKLSSSSFAPLVI